jgi:hypothetical protein
MKEQFLKTTKTTPRKTIGFTGFPILGVFSRYLRRRLKSDCPDSQDNRNLPPGERWQQRGEERLISSAAGWRGNDAFGEI